MPSAANPSVVWSRPEPFGAWIRLDDATLVAVDIPTARRLGVGGAGEDGGRTRPLELHVAVTSRCSAGCMDCYVDALPDGPEPSFDALRRALAEARDAGVSTIAFGGGEPLARRDVGSLAEHARALGLVPVMTTSGIGLTPERASELGAFAQINVSHDGVGNGYAAVRGWQGGAVAERAIAMLVAARVPVGVNLVVTRASFARVEETAVHVADLGARELQLLRYKPAGRAASLTYYAERLTLAQARALWPMIERLVEARRLGIRIDCAMVPLLSEALLALGSPDDVSRRLDALGVFGCEAGRHLGALDVAGALAPCSFAHRVPEESAGESSSLAARWDGDGVLEAWRAHHAAPREPCRSCPLRAVCRGGCQIVSRYATGGFGPDPECPRVRSAARG